jgi:3-phosphoshikimate 1-carboxyvinyltransferase
MKREMRKLGYVLHDRNDCELFWDGERCEPSLEEGIDTYNDHRMALSFAPFAMKAGSLIINDPQFVTKSYPHFWQSLQEAGFEIEVKTKD